MLAVWCWMLNTILSSNSMWHAIYFLVDFGYIWMMERNEYWWMHSSEHGEHMKVNVTNGANTKTITEDARKTNEQMNRKTQNGKRKMKWTEKGENKYWRYNVRYKIHSAYLKNCTKTVTMLSSIMHCGVWSIKVKCEPKWVVCGDDDDTVVSFETTKWENRKHQKTLRYSTQRNGKTTKNMKKK